MSKPIINLSYRPDSQDEISALADHAIRKAGAIGRLPTPMDDLISAAGVRDEPNPNALQESFLASLAASARNGFQLALQKIRGIADLRERVVHVPNNSTPPRLLFAKGHELGHQVIPWQQMNIGYQDDNFSLSPETEDLFDIEANFFSAEVIFQGTGFRKRALDYKASLDTAFYLANEHGASKHATLRRLIEESDELVAAAFYWPNRYVLDSNGRSILKLGTATCSPRFVTKYSDIELPDFIDSNHPWTEARRDSDEVCNGDINLRCGSSQICFQWQSWWNTYCLQVFLRRRPVLSLVRHLTI
jgi:Zn-dependent peptidase ImmA (M78 family)